MGELDSDITLGNNEYVTVRLELPDGYFNVQKASHSLAESLYDLSCSRCGAVICSVVDLWKRRSVQLPPRR